MTLQPLDVLAWKIGPESSWVERLVGWGERWTRQANSGRVNYSHVAFVSRNINWMYSAQPPRTNLYPVPDTFLSYIEVYRLKSVPNADQIRRICMYAQTRCGKWYPFLAVLTAGLVQIGGLEFCSELVNDSFQWGDLVLVPHHTCVSPDDLVASAALTRIL